VKFFEKNFFHLELTPSRGNLYIFEIKIFVSLDFRDLVNPTLNTSTLIRFHEFSHSIQIIGMSATLTQAELLSTWLDSKVYSTDFRPIKLYEYLLHDTTVFDLKSLRKNRELPNEFVMKSDTNRVIG
jgi:hypothetical protein